LFSLSWRTSSTDRASAASRALARREADKADLRVVRIRATPKGRKLLLEGRARRLRPLTQMLEGASTAEQAALAAAVSTLQRLLQQPTLGKD
jgi:DNA-binding MarR family transcriptional regulator